MQHQRGPSLPSLLHTVADELANTPFAWSQASAVYHFSLWEQMHPVTGSCTSGGHMHGMLPQASSSLDGHDLATSKELPAVKGQIYVDPKKKEEKHPTTPIWTASRLLQMHIFSQQLMKGPASRYMTPASKAGEQGGPGWYSVWHKMHCWQATSAAISVQERGIPRALAFPKNSKDTFL